MEQEKFDYSIRPDYPMYDMCHCCANCATPCGRKQEPVERYFSMTDFSPTCVKYVEKV